MNSIHEIDITKQSRAMAVIYVMNLLILFCFALIPLEVVLIFVDAIWQADVFDEQIITLSFASIVLPLLKVLGGLIISFGVYTAWRDTEAMRPSTWTYYAFYIPLFLPVGGVIAFGTSRLEASQVGAVFFLVLPILAAVVAYPRVFFLRRTKLRSINVSLTTLLSSLNRNKSIGTKAVRRLPNRKQHVFLGITLGSIGAAIFIVPVILSTLFGMSSKNFQALRLLTPLGIFLLLISRRYLQVSADSLLAADNRKPILFLRSFEDDIKRTRQSLLVGVFALVDFSLETRLANYFMNLGPFIAIGSPTEKLPLPGAARVKLSDSEWQDRVLSWIRDASIIVMYIGKTHWVSWELQRVLESSRMEHLILLMPDIEIKPHWEQEKGQPQRHKKEMAERVDCIKSALRNSIWEGSLNLITESARVRALVFHRDGSVTVVKSKGVVTRQKAHLAALVAHYVMITEQAPHQHQAIISLASKSLAPLHTSLQSS